MEEVLVEGARTKRAGIRGAWAEHWRDRRALIACVSWSTVREWTMKELGRNLLQKFQVSMGEELVAYNCGLGNR